MSDTPWADGPLPTTITEANNPRAPQWGVHPDIAWVRLVFVGGPYDTPTTPFRITADLAEGEALPAEWNPSAHSERDFFMFTICVFGPDAQDHAAAIDPPGRYVLRDDAYHWEPADG